MIQKQLLGCLLAISIILGVKNGYLTLWKNGNPVEVYPFQVKFLPLSDQKMLNIGIEISSEAELAQVLEDFLS